MKFIFEPKTKNQLELVVHPHLVIHWADLVSENMKFGIQRTGAVLEFDLYHYTDTDTFINLYFLPIPM